ncbi:protein kinase [Nitzschia inconspicua]|uniref:Protein kinase n=1 Tax=Nitzschia inconspicua TaxID=303405 RepID=A0A9K3LE20_9STRA|nr:protein kinase [Nitzschia inconspicua]
MEYEGDEEFDLMVAEELRDVKEKYKILEILGSGSYGTVRKCKDRKTGELLACKTIKKSKVDNFENLRREITILESVDHPNIIKFVDVYEDEKYIHLVTELCTGGELYDRVLEKAESPEGHFQEDDAAILIRDILDAIRYMHDEKHIVHRDLKVQNFLLKDKSDNAQIKIIDFGLSRKDDAPFGIMSSRVGTPYYVAPEVLLNSYTYKVDMWSIGVIAYILLCGFAPFSGDTDYDTLQLVARAPLEFPSPEWDDVSEEAIDFLTKLLDRDPDKRPTANEAMQHPWIAKHVVPPGIPKPMPFKKRSISENDKFSSSSFFSESEKRSAFQKFLANIKVKKALQTVNQIMTPTEARYLGNVFRKIDKDNDGKIRVQDIDRAVEAGNFSNSVAGNLVQMRSIMYSTKATAFDIYPFLEATSATSRDGNGRAKSTAN